MREMLTETSETALIRRGKYGQRTNTTALKAAHTRLARDLVFDYAGGLAFNRAVSPADAKFLLGRFLARLDRALLGRDWAKAEHTTRTWLIAYLEQLASNPHYHFFANFPYRLPYKPSTQHYEKLVEQVWRKVVPGGSTDVTWIYDRNGAASYYTKELYRSDALENIVLSSEFWA